MCTGSKRTSPVFTREQDTLLIIEVDAFPLVIQSQVKILSTLDLKPIPPSSSPTTLLHPCFMGR